METKFVCSWTSGYPDRRPMYLWERDDRWGATEDKNEASRYSTKNIAIQAWLKKHAFPEDYLPYVKAGHVRAEEVAQMEFCL